MHARFELLKFSILYSFIAISLFHISRQSCNYPTGSIPAASVYLQNMSADKRSRTDRNENGGRATVEQLGAAG